MSENLKDDIAAIQNIQFETTVSEEMNASERYHAQMMKKHVYDKLEEELKDAIKRRSNLFYVFFREDYGYDKPKPHEDSPVIKETLNALNSLPWVARASFTFKDLGEPTLTVYIQNPETKMRLFPSKDRHDEYYKQFYEGERQIEQAPAPKALPPPEPKGIKKALQVIGLIKPPPPPLQILPPQVSDPELEASEEKTISPNQKLADEFKQKAQDIKNYALQIHGLDIDFAPLEQAIGKIDALLNADWDEDVIGASRSSFRSALSDLGFLRDSFKENAQILSIVNNGASADMSLETLSKDTLDGLKHNFENVTKSVENSVRRAINARIDRAEIGVEVHETKLQIERFRDVDLVPVNTHKMALDN